MIDTKPLLEATARQALRYLRDLPGNLESEDDPAFTTEQVNFLEKRLFDVCAILEAAQAGFRDADIDLQIRQLLASNRQIAHIWCIDDVRDVRSDLSEDAAWEVLQEADRRIDSEMGISWDTIEIIAADMFPEPADKKGDRS